MGDKTNLIRWSIILGSFIIISSILWNTYIFFQNFKSEERIKMEIWSKAQIELINSNEDKISPLTLDILRQNTSTPMIKVNNDGSIEHNNIQDFNPLDSLLVDRLIKKFSRENKPIEIPRVLIPALSKTKASIISDFETKHQKNNIKGEDPSQEGIIFYFCL